MTSPALPSFTTRFRARFDSRLLQAPLLQASSQQRPLADAALCAGAQQLRLTLQKLTVRSPGFASAHFPLHPSAEERTRQLAYLQSHLLQLDGTHYLQSLGGKWAQAWYRLGLKWQEASGQVAAEQVPWDCGFIRNGADLAACLQLFQPRRPSFLAAWQLPTDSTQTVLSHLQAQATQFAHPVRLLLCQAPTEIIFKKQPTQPNNAPVQTKT